jgi:putative tryptophan/tyrosine transport system substrate-binding protein
MTRWVVALLALGLVAAPLAAEAQQAGKVYRIGFLGTFPSVPGPHFLDGLREHGYVEGQNLTIERRFSDGKADRLPALVADLLRLNVQLIVASAPVPSRAAKDATTTVPIVFVGVADLLCRSRTPSPCPA